MKRFGFLVLACAACATSKMPAPEPASTEPACPQKRTDVGGADVSTVLGTRVAKVCVVGGGSDLNALVSGAENQPLDSEAVNALLAELYKTGSVHDAEVIATPLSEESLVLTFFVKPYAAISKIRIDPALDLDRDAFTNITTNSYAIASPRVLRAMSSAVREIYVEHGYPNATSTAAMVEDEAVVTVHAGARDDITKIRFSGAKRIKEAELLSLMKSREGEPYSADTALRDQLYIQALYLDHGMLRIAVTPSYQNGELLMAINEGDVFKVSAIAFAGVPLRDTNALLTTFQTKRGHAFSRAAAIHDIELIRQRAAEQGKQVNVLPSTQLDDKKKTVALTFELEASAHSD